MKQFNQYVKPPHRKIVDMFDLIVEFYDYHNDISFCDAIVIEFNDDDIPLSKWDNDLFLQFINDIEAGKDCEFRYRNHKLDYFIYKNDVLLYSINDAGVLEDENELIFESEYIDCLKKMHQDIEKYIQFINNRSPEEKQMLIDREKRHEELRRQYANEKEYLKIKYGINNKSKGPGIMALIANGSQDKLN